MPCYTASSRTAYRSFTSYKICSRRPTPSVTVLQGGKEASRSNAVLHRIITDCIQEVQPEVGRQLISLITSRAAIDELLALDDVIDLVGILSQQQAQSI